MSMRRTLLALLGITALLGCPPPLDDDDSASDDDAPNEVRDAFGAAAGSYTMEAASLAGGADPAGILTIGQLYGVTVSDTEFFVQIGTNTGVVMHPWDFETTEFEGDPDTGQVTIILVEEDLSGASVTWSEAFGGLTNARLVLPGGAPTWSLSPPGT